MLTATDQKPQKLQNSTINHTNVDIQAMLVWLIVAFCNFCGFRSVAVNTVYKLQFFYIYLGNSDQPLCGVTSSLDFVAQPYRADATAHIATATNRLNKREPPSQTNCANNCRVIPIFYFERSLIELTLLIYNTAS